MPRQSAPGFKHRPCLLHLHERTFACPTPLCCLAAAYTGPGSAVRVPHRSAARSAACFALADRASRAGPRQSCRASRTLYGHPRRLSTPVHLVARQRALRLFCRLFLHVPHCMLVCVPLSWLAAFSLLSLPTVSYQLIATLPSLRTPPLLSPPALFPFLLTRFPSVPRAPLTRRDDRRDDEGRGGAQAGGVQEQGRGGGNGKEEDGDAAAPHNTPSSPPGPSGASSSKNMILNASTNSAVYSGRADGPGRGPGRGPGMKAGTIRQWTVPRTVHRTVPN